VNVIAIRTKTAPAGTRLSRGGFAPKLWSAVFRFGAAFAVAGLPAVAQPQADFAASSVTGQLALVRSVNLSRAGQMLGLLSASAKPEVLKTPPPRLRPPLSSSRSLLLAAGAQTATVTPRSLTVTAASTATGFNALSHLDQRTAYGGNQFSIEPPSQSIATGNGYILEGVNNAVQVYTSSGAPVLSAPVASNQLFGLAPAINWSTGVNGVYLTDMRVYFDSGISRWFVAQRSQDNDAAGNPLPRSHLYLAVSKTPDPAGDYLIYMMETTNASHPGCPCIADYPQIGSDQYAFHISWNEFNAFALSFVDASIISISKAAFAAGSATPIAYQFLLPFTTGYEFAIQPATTAPDASNFLASGGVEYFVSSSARFFGSSGVALWAVRNTSSLATPSPNLVLSRVVVSTLGYTFPDVATQRPGPLPYGSSLKPAGVLAYLDGGDARVLSATYAGGRLFLTLQTGVQDASGRWVVGAAYVVLSPTFRSNVLAASVVNQGYLLVNGNHLLRPAIAVNAKGRGAIAVTLVGPDWFPTAGVVRFDAFGVPAAVETAAAGVLPEDGFTGYPGGGAGVARWGDYNGAVAASDGSIWTVTQYIGNYPRTPAANWNTYVAHVIP
jgi:hypothetical protein